MRKGLVLLIVVLLAAVAAPTAGAHPPDLSLIHI